jgi:uncharacterized protein YrrD
MNTINNYDVEGARGLLSFQGRPIISISDGQRIGTVDDILVDPGTNSGDLRLHGLVTAKSGFLRPEVNAIPVSEIFLWGQDVVLVKRSDTLVKRDTLPGLENCLSAYHGIPGRDVISLGGDRLGEMRDLLITPSGEMAGFVADRTRGELAELVGDGKEHRLPVSAIQSFGRDVLILDLSKLREMVPPAEPKPGEVS